MKKALLSLIWILLATALPVMTASCGHTAYGVGSDMERLGRKIKGEDPEPPAYTPPPQPQTWPGYQNY